MADGIRLTQQDEHLRRAVAQAHGDAHAILDKLADRYRNVRGAAPMTKESREARVLAVAAELFGNGRRATTAEREALRLAPPVTDPITRAEYGLRLLAVMREA
ncbi:hypothetical protein [Streptomyces vinaceus]|uniref:hypothetical protein n=1 Tax=Streptomyces vinaceus TaxID=1960 RepID=UPI00367C1FBD